KTYDSSTASNIAKLQMIFQRMDHYWWNDDMAGKVLKLLSAAHGPSVIRSDPTGLLQNRQNKPKKSSMTQDLVYSLVFQ
ncbi:MAG: hypothetical protein ACAI44_26600, partial [Candidatus Sericytochromatia bacterium]